MKPVPKEKVIKIGNFRLKYETACVAVIVVILALSSFGYIATQESAPEQQENKVQTLASVDFGNFSTVRKTLLVEQGSSAEAAFKEIENISISTQNTENGKIAVSITSGNWTRINNNTDWWVFYVNGVINFNGLDRYEVKDRDVLDLRFEHEPY